MHDTVSFTFECDCTAPGQVREALRTLGGVRYDALLLASELVSWAVLEGECEPRSELQVIVEPVVSGARITVRCPDPNVVRTLVGGCPAAGLEGLRLSIIQAIATRWGIEREPHLRVWAEVSIWVGAA
jgi:hypothetical protein